MVLSISDPPGMAEARNHMSTRILELALEIISLITGEDYTVVKKSSGECVTPRVSGGGSRTPSPITEPPPHSLRHEQKILELTSRITELLSGEVPIRCQDVTVYFSMEEWEYLEGHKDLYKEVMMEDQQPLTSADGASPRNPPERCPSPPYSQDCPEDPELNVPLDPQVLHVGSFQDSDDSRATSGLEIPISVSETGEDEISDCHGHSMLCPRHGGEEDQPQTEHHPGKNFVCSECGKHFQKKPYLYSHMKVHIADQRLTCTECGKSFSRKLTLVEHQRIHTGEKPFLCTECGKCFTYKSDLVKHQRIHTGEKPYSCVECGKCFLRNGALQRHQKVHTGEKPFLCSECGKWFTSKSSLECHQRIHTGEKPFLCTDCGKRFTSKLCLENHHRIHTGEKPYSCVECGKCFLRNGALQRHQKVHTGEKPFLCLECGKWFTSKSSLEYHQRIHTGEKPFLCFHCEKRFTSKSCMENHKRIHTRLKTF
ncbi:uncharacterized protein LOC142196128 [Leptodactylus fuscus]|uniref:uncharacterized protein LOC142196128 n=1 Tax=Leptodactylus fuscus TaxID=238119 RepID=UPI003F4F185B